MAEVEFFVLVVIVLLILVIAYLTKVNTGLANELKNSIPPEALEFTGGVVKVVMASLEAHVAKTPNKLDDEAFLLLAGQMGYKVVKKPDDPSDNLDAVFG